MTASPSRRLQPASRCGCRKQLLFAGHSRTTWTVIADYPQTTPPGLWRVRRTSSITATGRSRHSPSALPGLGVKQRSEEGSPPAGALARRPSGYGSPPRLMLRLSRPRRRSQVSPTVSTHRTRSLRGSGSNARGRPSLPAGVSLHQTSGVEGGQMLGHRLTGDGHASGDLGGGGRPSTLARLANTRHGSGRPMRRRPRGGSSTLLRTEKPSQKGYYPTAEEDR